MNNLLNFKSFFKFLSRNKTFTSINVFGLSVSLMFVILILVYVNQGLSTDRFQKNADTIYAIANENNIGSAWRIAERLAKDYPEFEKMCPLVNYSEYGIFIGDKKYKADLLMVDTTFFTMFTFPLVQGDPNTVLEAKNHAVISESFAKRIFSDRDPMGQYIKVNDSVSVMVNGIMKDIKNSTIPYSDIVFKIDNVHFFNESLDSEHGYNAMGVQAFFQTVPGSNIQAKQEEIAEYLKTFFWVYERNIFQKVIFVPLTEIYFSKLQATTYMNQNSWTFVVIFMFIGILILIFAVINYINLTVAQTGSRAKEMATRRLLGSSRSELFFRLIIESTIVCTVSFFIGLLLAFAVLPFANDLLQVTIDLKGFFNLSNSLIVIGVILLVGLISGLLPAIIISNSKPIDIVRGGFRTKTKMVFSKIFITFQNVITIMLLAASLTMILQINHMIKAPLGYNTTNMLYVPTYQFESREKVNTFVNETRQLASVNRVAYSQGVPFNRGNNWTLVYEERNISFQVLRADTTFFNMLGLEIIHKNNVDGNQMYFSEQAMRELNLPIDATEVKLWENETTFIAGVVRDFQLLNISYGIKPILVVIEKEEDIHPWNVLIETQGDPFIARDQVKEVYERISQLEFTGQYTEQQVEESYTDQQRMAKLVIIFAIIAIVISLLGLLAMSTYFIQQRSREVAVRKVFGSSNSQVLIRLISTFMSYVGIAFIIATPVAWYVMNKWIADYPYRISLYPWIFITAGLFCLIVAFITVFYQSYQAANSNPVNNVKTE
ncbi:putative ABC transport system permease protein [Parabacteroides sp. PF5-5]|uniref:ABC transporter permease n=1 Tax=unclassified Parabacteroides TaxID=2649774 RepID=UPI002474B3C3|nr:MULTISPECIES: ABC transporter permease [unclassified Parabacteroides]MDH6304551.1 putative ABC transport system permease protein [Parabacteroides sp. PH5-39]MDH6315297.1 putative ABC transport system permease protein [Parabacteroides sp. PF5-13]MDH6319209.1 putative ABC transport system permease protein [Parabacteroides sp. PH5-13]MDH6322940.1 putative ABC transport system permease protein [Parabacteroides sp. PH5-8]MDH6326488.1 putative ABC transport system permease protein [Parabacteroide